MQVNERKNELSPSTAVGIPGLIPHCFVPADDFGKDHPHFLIPATHT